ncbi:uncharacterized protein LOC134227182 isoform X1 [Armigeres subalbatus]|uniref:uncharacterized protein LOC134227182 isoform X1 n=1 Tax=Armigeres subalbatus TaxID=124917 RepID=UPI002ED00E17
MGSFVRVASAGVSGQLESAGGNGVPTRHATTVDDNRATVKRLIKYLMVTRCKYTLSQHSFLPTFLSRTKGFCLSEKSTLLYHTRQANFSLSDVQRANMSPSHRHHRCYHHHQCRR